MLARNRTNLRIAFLILLGALGGLAQPAAAQILTDEAATLAQMEDVIEGESIDISNLQFGLGQARQTGTFTNGLIASGIDEGIFLATGRGNNFNQSANLQSSVTNNGSKPDPDLQALNSAATNDTASITLSITPQKNTIFARFAFASEEYPEYVCSTFNDQFGLFISGGDLAGSENIAVVPGSGSVISINTVNNGPNNNGTVCSGEPTNNSQFYNDNVGGTALIFDGYTDVFEVFVDVTPGETYDFKMAVADAIDNGYDSTIFFEVFDSRWVNDADLSLDLTSSVATPVVGEPFTITAILTNDGPDEVEIVEVGNILPGGLTLVGFLTNGGYDSVADVWTLPTTIAPNTSEEITLKVIAYDENTYQTTAEVITQWANDPDSTPDNADTNPEEDDTDTLTLGPDPAYTIDGQIFVDNGAGGGTAYNGIRDGGEAELPGVDVTLTRTDTGEVIGTITTDGEGAYEFPLPAGLAGTELSISTSSVGDGWFVSEAPGPLPGLVNPSVTDGTITFTPDPDTNYPDLDFGQVARPSLTADAEVVVAPGGSVLVPHLYTASTTGTVTFGETSRQEVPAGVFSSGIFLDADCSGTINNGEGSPSADIPVEAGDDICLILRHVTVAGAPSGAILTYDLVAVTTLTGTGFTDTRQNSDQVSIATSGAARLRKQVCNLTQSVCDAGTGTGFSLANNGAPGDRIQYRLIFEPTSAEPIDLADIRDQVPDFSGLVAGTVRFERAPGTMSCAVVTPAGGGTAGYSGPLHWQCNGGQLSSGNQIIATFDVEISQ